MRQSQQVRSQKQVQQSQYASKSSSQLYAPISAQIPRYCFAEDKYWFVIEAALEDGRHYELSRYYEDFYDFQIALLTEFPAEAGNTGEQKRTLPYMPGPVNYVTDAITEGRQHNLDAYVKNLLTQPSYISRCTLVMQFFAPREGDYEIDPNAPDGEYRLSGGSQPSSTESPTNGASRQSSRGTPACLRPPLTNGVNNPSPGSRGSFPKDQPGKPRRCRNPRTSRSRPASVARDRPR
jgi:bud emergence protein 1